MKTLPYMTLDFAGISSAMQYKKQRYFTGGRCEEKEKDRLAHTGFDSGSILRRDAERVDTQSHHTDGNGAPIGGMGKAW